MTLREEASQLACDTQYCEEKEKELVNDVIKQLSKNPCLGLYTILPLIHDLISLLKNYFSNKM